MVVADCIFVLVDFDSYASSRIFEAIGNWEVLKGCSLTFFSCASLLFS